MSETGLVGKEGEKHISVATCMYEGGSKYECGENSDLP